VLIRAATQPWAKACLGNATSAVNAAVTRILRTRGFRYMLRQKTIGALKLRRSKEGKA